MNQFIFKLFLIKVQLSFPPGELVDNDQMRQTIMLEFILQALFGPLIDFIF